MFAQHLVGWPALTLVAQPASAIEPGDSNRDGRVSAPDVTALARILGGAPPNEGADANRDGFILRDDIEAPFARICRRPLGVATPTVTGSASAAASWTPTGAPMPPSSTPTELRSATPTPTGMSPAAPTTTVSPTTVSSPTLTPSPSRTPSATVQPTDTPGGAAGAPRA